LGRDGISEAGDGRLILEDSGRDCVTAGAVSLRIGTLSESERRRGRSENFCVGVMPELSLSSGVLLSGLRTLRIREINLGRFRP
jgi:hypothetical protein